METQEEIIKDRAVRYGVPILREQSHCLLEELVKKYKPKNILEIGTAVGYSGLAMLNAYENASLITIEHDNYKVIEARNNFKAAGYENRATVIEGDCMVEVSLLVANGNYDNYFDFIFLDGPKAQYNKMLDGLLTLCKHGGIILADNVLFRGYVFGNKNEMPRRFKTIVKRLEMFINNVKTNSQIESYKLHNIEDGMLEIKTK